jgi:peptidoglycan/LPS O-acetylase OafA/YrhL
MIASRPAVAGHERGSYRPDIDGLRAVAVLAVVAYHAKPWILPGGFVGVDVFFVISGFLISGIILQRLRTGTFSFADFYARRIRRIFPALSLVLLACLVVGWVVLLPRELLDLGGDTAAGAGFVANIRFWNQTSYFGPDVTGKPLLHLWSLGIEEQYYLVWPLLLSGLWRTRFRLVPIVAALVGSFALNVYYSTADARAAFYSPAARLWELLLGSIIAYVTLTHGEPVSVMMKLGKAADAPGDAVLTAHVREACAWAGIGMIAVAFAAIRTTSVFPGWWVLLPTVGTALLICAGPDTWINRSILSDKSMVGVGLISYPLYLWHWPVLALIRIRYPDVSYSVKFLALFGALIAAYLTFRFMERPVRRAGGARAVVVLCVVQALLLGTGLLIYWKNGFPERGDAVHRRINAVSLTAAEMDESYAEGTCFLKLKQQPDEFPRTCYEAPAGAAGRPHLLLWGDSFAAHLLPGLQQVLGDSMTISQMTSSLCAPIVHYIETRRRKCAAINRYTMARIAETKPDVVVLSGRWVAYPQFADVGKTILELKKLGISRVVLMGSSAQYGEDVPRLILNALRHGPAPTRLHPVILPKLVKIDSVLKDVAARTGALFATPLDAECTKDGCLVSLDTAAVGITTWDDGHLTSMGSRYVIDRVLKPLLKQ